MKPIFFAATLAVATATPVVADSYDELNAGIAAWNEKDWSATILHLDKAIAAGDLASSLMRTAYLDRGRAHDEKGDTDLAAADYTAALSVAPGDVTALSLRAYLYAEHGKPEKAIEDLAAAHERKPRNQGIDLQIGLLSWELGRYDDALLVFERESKTDSYHYAWLWQQIVRLKQGKAVTAPEGHEESDDWPWPIIKVYLGKVREADVMSQAQNSDSAKSRLCETNFYFGEWHLLHGETAQAMPLLQAAKTDCPENTGESRMAKIALDHLQ